MDCLLVQWIRTSGSRADGWWFIPKYVERWNFLFPAWCSVLGDKRRTSRLRVWIMCPSVGSMYSCGNVSHWTSTTKASLVQTSTSMLWYDMYIHCARTFLHTRNYTIPGQNIDHLTDTWISHFLQDQFKVEETHQYIEIYSSTIIDNRATRLWQWMRE